MSKPAVRLEDVLARPVPEWKDLLVNDFEATVFEAHPELAAIKQSLYDVGAEKDAVRLVSGLDAMGYLPYALDRKQSAFAPLRGLLKQRDKSFELRIG